MLEPVWGCFRKRLQCTKPSAKFVALSGSTLWNRGRPYVSDTINGFRGLSRQAFETISPKSYRFTIEYELSIEAMRRGMKISEIATHEGQREGGESKAISLPVGIDFVKFFFSKVLEDLRSGGGGFRRRRS